MKIDAFEHLPVVSIETGAKLGTVDDLLFGADPLRVAAFRVRADGQQPSAPAQFLVLWGEVKTIGPDAIVVPHDATAHANLTDSSLATLPNTETMRKLKVIDAGGNSLGTVKELEVDLQSGYITQVEAHAGGMLGLGGTTTTIAAADIGSIGGEVLMVRTAGQASPPASPETR
jgi:uncharacterized protein YrrD